MKFKMIIDKTKDEEIVATVHEPSELTRRIEDLVLEYLPLPSAILIHAGVLYLDYLLVYLLNSWMPRDWSAIDIFTAVFLAGFAAIWLVIYLCIRRSTRQLNEKLRPEQG